MGKWFHLFQCKTAELFADHFQLFVETRCAHRDVGGLFLHQHHQPRADGLGVSRLG